MNKKNLKIGLKLWSPNTHLLKSANKLFRSKSISYIELYVVPKTNVATLQIWKKAEAPFVVHAPNESVLDLSTAEKTKENTIIFSEVQQFADELDAHQIIVHPGYGRIKESVDQLLQFSDKRICIENMPFHSLHNSRILVGSTYAHLEQMLAITNYHFCLDIGHAIVAAHNLKLDYMAFLQQLLTLKPVIFHLNDGFIDSEKDLHLHFGEGNFPIKKIIDLIPPDSAISLETPKKLNEGLNDFQSDLNFLREI